MKTTKTIVALTLAIGMIGCSGQRDNSAEPEPEPSSTTDVGTDEADTPEPVSILRSDVEQPVVAPIIDTTPLDIIIPFGEGGSTLSEEAITLLEGALISERMQSDAPIVLRGHSDAAGRDEANLRASRKRAEAVKAWLIEQGIDDTRIEIIAFGEQNPIAPNALPDGTPSEAGREANRRVELTIPYLAEVEAEPALESTPDSSDAAEE